MARRSATALRRYSSVFYAEGNTVALKHGHTSDRGVYERSPTYNSWRSMKERCYRPAHRWFHRYGGRGITVCERWLGKQGFSNFLVDMGERPAGMSLDRVDNDKGYSPDNCKWSTATEQNNNQHRGKRKQ